MKKYKSLIKEQSIKNMRVQVVELYHNNVNSFKNFSALIDFISNELGIDKNTISMILQDRG